MCARSFTVVIFAFALLSGCAAEGSACDQAMDARLACMDQAGVAYNEEDVRKALTACGALHATRPDFRDFVSCQQETFLSADCPTEAAAQDAVVASESCGTPF